MDRRTFLKRTATYGGGLAVRSPFQMIGVRAALGEPLMRGAGYGPLVDEGDLALPEAFNYSIISRQVS